MKSSRHPFFKPALLLVVLVLFVGVGFFQGQLNTLRADPAYELTRMTPLENAPPVLAFTTVALGGFRGLIANVLWIRANDLQYSGKYFEMVQLADWITKLEPHFVQVWLYQSWNMAYNISVKFDNPEDRWRWVQQGISLLRDQGIPLNPREALLYRELAWFFQHKMGDVMDNAHLHYKLSWAEDMEAVFPGGAPDYTGLLQPATEAESNRLALVTGTYRLKPEVMQAVDEAYGPLDWRASETHAIYWAFLGLKESRAKDQTTLRRVIYQSMRKVTLQGRIWMVESPEGRRLRFGPNLETAERSHQAFLDMLALDDEKRAAIEQAHRNFLLDLVELMYQYNRLQQAEHWFQVAKITYPEQMPKESTFEAFAQSAIAYTMQEMAHGNVRGYIEGILVQAYFSLAYGQSERATAMFNRATFVYRAYAKRIQGQEERLGLPPLLEMRRTVRDGLLTTGSPNAMDPVLAAQLRTVLGLPPPGE